LADVKKEVERLLDANFIRPCRYAEWISNIVPVYKKNGKMRVAADEGLIPSLLLFDSWDFQELKEHVLSQVPVPDARGSRAPTTPERRPIRRRCQASPPAPSLRF
jgi:hypothetical protein